MKVEVGKGLDTVWEKVQLVQKMMIELGQHPTHLVLSEVMASRLLLEFNMPSKNSYYNPNDFLPEKLAGADLGNLTCLVRTHCDPYYIEVMELL